MARPRFRLTYFVLLVTASLFASIHLSAQCSICRDATAGTAPQMRSALRKAIPVLGLPALGIFSAIVTFAIRRDTAHDETGDVDRDGTQRREQE